MDSRFVTAPKPYKIELDGSLIVDGSASTFLRVRDGQLVSIVEDYRVFHIDEPEYLNEKYRDSHTDEYGICDDCDDDFGYKAFYILAEECNGN